jgi:MFS transporter, FHS family, L-fucose permease
MSTQSPKAEGETRAAPSNFGLALTALSTVFFMWGFCTVLNDILVPHLKAVFEMNYVRTMLIQFVFFGSYLLLSLPSAKFIERWGYKYAIITGLGGMALGCMLFVPAASLLSYGMFLAALFVLAGGITLLQVAANPYVAMLGRESTASARLNFVQAFNSLATTVGPWFGGLLILSRTKAGTEAVGASQSLVDRMADAQAVQYPYFAIAIVLVLVVVLISVVRLPDVAPAGSGAAPATGSLRKHRLLVLGVVAIFVYVGAEVTIGSFLISYITSPHISRMTSASAAGYISFYWGGAMLGRFVGAAMMRAIPPARLLRDNCVTAIFLVLCSMAAHGPLAMWAMLLVGLCNSIMFPTIFALAIRGLGPLTGRGSGLLVMAICGGAVLPVIQGLVADTIGLTVSFLVPAVCYLYIWFFALRSFENDGAGGSTADKEDKRDRNFVLKNADRPTAAGPVERIGTAPAAWAAGHFTFRNHYRTS